MKKTHLHKTSMFACLLKTSNTQCEERDQRNAKQSQHHKTQKCVLVSAVIMVTFFAKYRYLCICISLPVCDFLT